VLYPRGLSFSFLLPRKPEILLEEIKLCVLAENKMATTKLQNLDDIRAELEEVM
jgi:hypothetical protein